MGVGVGWPPPPPYFASIAARASRRDLPALRIAITSRVMSRQIVHVAAWLVKVMVLSLLNDLM
jgi:hypothetical protein